LGKVVAGGLTLVLCASLATAAVAQLEVTTLPQPAWKRGGGAGTATVRLEVVSTRRNAITDVAAWFRRNRLTLREYRLPGTSDNELRRRPLPSGTPTRFRGQELVQAIYQRNLLLLVYGDGAVGRYLVARRSGTPRYAFDFINYAYAPPGTGPVQTVTWAAETGGVLYVSHSHQGYARESRGLNGYLTAIDVSTRRARWRSRPLVANARTFDVAGNVIIAGYGYTAEADALYLLDRRSGAIVQRVPLPSAPEFIIRRGKTVFVRTYDRDVVLELERKA
jgi:hypothetical protein